MNKKRMYKRINKKIRKVMGYMYSIENVWNETRDLKLYDVFFDCEDIVSKYPLLNENDNANDCFYDFCDNQYSQFLEEFTNGYLEDLRKYVGRTSKFFITDLGGYRVSPVQVLENLLNEVNGMIDFEFNDDLSIKPLNWSDYYTENELIEEYHADLEYLINDFYKDVKKYMDKAVKLAQYIDDYKKNQVEYFNGYCECREEDLQYDKEQAEIQEIENKIDLGAWAVCYAL